MKKIILLLAIFNANYLPIIIGMPAANCFSQNTWVQKASFVGTAREGAIGFSIGTKGYIGTGWIWDTYFQDFWEWDQSTNVWTQKANFPGLARAFASSFSIGTKGYICTGLIASDKSGEHYAQDFWEWDQSSNSWTKKSDFAGTGRKTAIGFSIGNKGYLGTGNDGAYTKDFWEWDQTTDTWSKKTNLIGGERDFATGFSIGNKGYIGFGEGNISINGSTYMQDFWQWDQATDTWTQKANFGGLPRAAAIGFSIGNIGYIGTGNCSNGNANDFWEWDSSTNIWVQRANFGGTARGSAVGFSIGTKGYVGTGDYSLNDFWEYTPSSETGINELKNTGMLNVFPNPAINAVTINFSGSSKGKLVLNITNELGETVYSENKKDFAGEYINTIDLSKHPKGTYFVEMISGNERTTRKIILE